MKRHYKPLLLALIFVCAGLLLTSCTGGEPKKSIEDYEAEVERYKEEAAKYEEEASAYAWFFEDELYPALNKVSGAYDTPRSYFKVDTDLSVEEAITILVLYIDGDELEHITPGKAWEAYSLINGYLEYSLGEIEDLRRSARENFGD